MTDVKAVPGRYCGATVLKRGEYLKQWGHCGRPAVEHVEPGDVLRPGWYCQRHRPKRK